jgi:hypothetical protein
LYNSVPLQPKRTKQQLHFVASMYETEDTFGTAEVVSDTEDHNLEEVKVNKYTDFKILKDFLHTVFYLQVQDEILTQQMSLKHYLDAYRLYVKEEQYVLVKFEEKSLLE